MLRDKLIEIIGDALIESMGDHSAVADAILAALPGMIPELVWERVDLCCWGQNAKDGMGGLYRMTWEFGVGPKGEDTFFTVQFNYIGIYSGWSFDADIAMAAVNAHHRAAIAQAAGWTA
jgi:hypothetical protein